MEDLIQKFLESYEDDRDAFNKSYNRFERKMANISNSAYNIKHTLTKTYVEVAPDVIINFGYKGDGDVFTDNSKYVECKEGYRRAYEGEYPVTADALISILPLHECSTVKEVQDILNGLPKAVNTINSYFEKMDKKYGIVDSNYHNANKLFNKKFSDAEKQVDKLNKQYMKEHPFGEGSVVYIKGKKWTVKSIDEATNTVKMFSDNGAVKKFDFNAILERWQNPHMGRGLADYDGENVSW